MVNISQTTNQKEGTMQNFVVSGKAKTVFRLIELMARGEKAEETEKKESKGGRK